MSTFPRFVFQHQYASSISDNVWQLAPLEGNYSVEAMVYLASELHRINGNIGLKTITIERDNHNAPIRLQFDQASDMTPGETPRTLTIDDQLYLDFSTEQFAATEAPHTYTAPVLFVNPSRVFATGQAVSTVADLRSRRLLTLAEFNSPAPAVLYGTGRQVSRASRDLTDSLARTRGGQSEYMVEDGSGPGSEFVSRVTPVHGVTGGFTIIGYLADPDAKLIADPYLLASYGVMSTPIGRNITTELDAPYYHNDDSVMITMVETMVEIQRFALLGYVA